MIEREPFGATGHDSSRAIFGAAALGKVSKSDADRVSRVPCVIWGSLGKGALAPTFDSGAAPGERAA